MAETVEDAPSAGPGDEIKPYKVHVSSRSLRPQDDPPSCLQVADQQLDVPLIRRSLASTSS